jgi:hypothetical protein
MSGTYLRAASDRLYGVLLLFWHRKYMQSRLIGTYYRYVFRYSRYEDMYIGIDHRLTVMNFRSIRISIIIVVDVSYSMYKIIE